MFPALRRRLQRQLDENCRASENETKAQEAPAATVNTTDRIKISPRARNAAENRRAGCGKGDADRPERENY